MFRIYFLKYKPAIFQKIGEHSSSRKKSFANIQIQILIFLRITRKARKLWVEIESRKDSKFLSLYITLFCYLTIK